MNSDLIRRLKTVISNLHPDSPDVETVEKAIAALTPVTDATKQAVVVANQSLEIPLHPEYCPHGAKWGGCEQCPR